MPFCWHCVVGRQHTQTSGKLTMVSTETLPFLPWPDTRVKTEMGMAGLVGKLGQLYLGPRRHRRVSMVAGAQKVGSSLFCTARPL